jgi:hypothetical protein
MIVGIQTLHPPSPNVEKSRGVRAAPRDRGIQVAVLSGSQVAILGAGALSRNSKLFIWFPKSRHQKRSCIDAEEAPPKSTRALT